jgi:poly(beta-D-mannuronate) lyase
MTFRGCRFLLVMLLGAVLSDAAAREYRISSAAELERLSLAAGDKVILEDREWKDQRLVFKGKGTERAPIVLTTEKPGITRLTGHSTLLIDGEWLVVDGVYFTDGYSKDKDVIVFAPTSAHCRLTNSAVVGYNHPDKKVDYKWVSVFGHYNRVDHCWLEEKTHQGTTLVIWLDNQPNYDRIDHNYFGPRSELGGNGGETIRIGNSTWSLHDSYTTVEENVFEHCDGELEIISNKSGHNTIRYNLFYESKGTLTLRHGNDADVYGNYFLGNGLEGTGGIRIIGENHQVHHNYFQNLTGTGLSAALSMMAGLPNPQLTSHWQVKNAHIHHNVILDCKESFSIGAGKNRERYLSPLNTVFADNIIVTSHQALHWVDDSVAIQFRGNLVQGASDAHQLKAGFAIKDPKLAKAATGLYVPNKKFPQPFWIKEKVGPNWIEPKNYQPNQ